LAVEVGRSLLDRGGEIDLSAAATGGTFDETAIRKNAVTYKPLSAAGRALAMTLVADIGMRIYR
jgi:hypothetical protein